MARKRHSDEDCLYEPSMKDRLEELKTQREALSRETASPEPVGIDILLHPRASEVYGRWVDRRLDQSLKGDNPHEAVELIRSLINHIDLIPRADGSGLDATLYGALAQILAVCNEISGNKKHPEDETSGCLLSVVAGAAIPKIFSYFAPFNVR